MIKNKILKNMCVFFRKKFRKKITNKKRLKSGYCSIHELEYLANKYNGINGEQLVLFILKEKGAPVNGVLLLSVDTINYEWSRYKKNEFDVFIWKIKENLPQ
jgi:hypothetical protein